MVSKFTRDNLDLLIVTVRIKNNLSYGICESKKNGELLKIKEKPNFYYDIIGGLYMMSPKILKYIPKNKSLDITNLINKIKKTKERYLHLELISNNGMILENLRLIKKH